MKIRRDEKKMSEKVKTNKQKKKIRLKSKNSNLRSNQIKEEK